MGLFAIDHGNRGTIGGEPAVEQRLRVGLTRAWTARVARTRKFAPNVTWITQFEPRTSITMTRVPGRLFRADFDESAMQIPSKIEARSSLSMATDGFTPQST